MQKETRALVTIQDNRVVVSSRQVAKHFGKEHKNVLRDIKDIVEKTGGSILSSQMFYETTYENRGKQYPEYLMNRDGFSLLVMGFTGQEALNWKLKYIEAFNKMEEMIKNNMQPMSKLDILEMQVKLLREQERRTKALEEKTDLHASRLTALENKMMNPFSRTNSTLFSHDMKLNQHKDKIDNHEDRIGNLEGIFDDKGPAEEIKTTIDELVDLRQGTLDYKDAYNNFYRFLKNSYHVDVYTRLRNLQSRKRKQGTSETEIKKLTKLDALTADPSTWDTVRECLKVYREEAEVE